ncbi:MAG: DUF6291 domain-containing protein [Oscillospiraceae bacterium]
MTEKNYHTDNKSFMMYKDWEELFLALESDEQRGQLLRALFAFAKRGETPELEGAVKMAFLVMSQQIDRDGQKWEEVCRERAKAGRKGGLHSPKEKYNSDKQKEAKEANAYFAKQTQAKQADKDKEEDTDKETEKDKDTVTDTEEEKETDTDTEKDKDTEKMLTQEEFDELVGLSSLSSVRKYLSKISDWQSVSHKTIRSPYKTIKSWIEQDRNAKKQSVQSQDKSTYENGCNSCENGDKPSYDLDEWEQWALNFNPMESLKG